MTIQYNIRYNQTLGALTLNSSGTSPPHKQNWALLGEAECWWPPHTPCKEYQAAPLSKIYRQGLHSCPPESLSNPPSSTPYFFPALYFHTSSLPPSLNPSPQTPLSPVSYLLHAPSCRVWESWHELHGTEQEQTLQATALPQKKFQPLSSSAEFISWDTCRRIRAHQPHTEGETSQTSHRRRNLTCTAK